MFSEEALIKMASGVNKSVKLIKVNDIVMNNRNLPVKIIAVNKAAVAHDAITIQINNGSGVFYCSPSTKFNYHDTLVNNSHSSGYDTIANIVAKNNAFLKSSLKIFSSDSDIDILTYNAVVVPKDLYCFRTNDSSYTFFINGIIVKCE